MLLGSERADVPCYYYGLYNGFTCILPNMLNSLAAKTDFCTDSRLLGDFNARNFYFALRIFNRLINALINFALVYLFNKNLKYFSIFILFKFQTLLI